MDGNLITNQQKILHSFNNYFLTLADKITSNTNNDKTSFNCNNSTHTHTRTHSVCIKNFKLPCSNMKLNYTTHREIEKNYLITEIHKHS